MEQSSVESVRRKSGVAAAAGEVGNEAACDSPAKGTKIVSTRIVCTPGGPRARITALLIEKGWKREKEKGERRDERL